ncbi:unnamed protein product [Tetraodon nigroviridis]|uniref:(spotted green pufferfish) hypothetical protein n=1 Tax=Tetraodon nigroviridis TaxID=99883 RepID=Q4SK08_TETNG|nr:unnamed protein product [Tetraodon nigroviridis]
MARLGWVNRAVIKQLLSALKKEFELLRTRDVVELFAATDLKVVGAGIHKSRREVEGKVVLLKMQKLGRSGSSHPQQSGLLSPPSRRHQWRDVNRSSRAGKNLDTTGVLNEIGTPGTVENRAAQHYLPHPGVSSAGPNITLEGRYHCYQGPAISLDRLCDFTRDCPLGDDEGDHCRDFLNGSYCSFEDGDCSWKPIAGRTLSWKRLQSSAKPPRQSCPSSGATFSVEGGHAKGQRGSALLRSPLFPPPLRNSPCTVRFWLCSRGLHKGSLSLWLLENSTGPEEQRPLWSSASEAKSEKSWKLITLPLYGLADWFWLQFSTENGPGPGSSVSLDNISFSMDCFLACEYSKMWILFNFASFDIWE